MGFCALFKQKIKLSLILTLIMGLVGTFRMNTASYCKLVGRFSVAGPNPQIRGWGEGGEGSHPDPEIRGAQFGLKIRRGLLP